MSSAVVTTFWLQCYLQLVPLPRMVLLEACFASPTTVLGAASHKPEPRCITAASSAFNCVHCASFAFTAVQNSYSGVAGRLLQQRRHQCGFGRFSYLDCKLLQAVARYCVRKRVLDFSMAAGVGLTRKKMQGQGWG